MITLPHNLASPAVPAASRRRGRCSAGWGLDARLAEIEFAIAACEGNNKPMACVATFDGGVPNALGATMEFSVERSGAEVPNAEAVVQVEGEAATLQAQGAENAPAGSAAAFNGIPLGKDVGEKPYHGRVPPPRKLRVAKRDVSEDW